MNFTEIISEFENKIKDIFRFELLEHHYMRYAFGSGENAYRINGRNVKLVYDGRDSFIEAFITDRQVKYPTNTWVYIFHGPIEKFLSEGVIILIDKVKS